MALTILSVAYPFAPVGPDAVGGAEQILTLVDDALVQAGHRSLVVACVGSVTRDVLIPTACVQGPLDECARAVAQARHRAAIRQALAMYPVDLVHVHGLDFDRYLPPPGIPLLATLHLPPEWYAPAVFECSRPETYLQCVSGVQRRTCPPSVLPQVDPVPNGVPLDRLWLSSRKAGFALVLGRICPEKGIHLAIEAARLANVPLVVAGKVYPYPAHERYFREMVEPLLDGHSVRFIGAVGISRKRRLLALARCVLVPSLAPETSSLVAMESLACGTPVVAFRTGALAEVVEHGRTGFIVESVEDMAEAMGTIASITPAACRRAAKERFSAKRMVEQYLCLYERLATRPAITLARSFGCSRLEVEEVTQLSGLDRVRQEWLDLWWRCPWASVFQHPDWLGRWCTAFGVREPWALLLRNRGSLVGVVPLLVYRRGDQRVLTLMGAGVSDDQDVIFDPLLAGSGLTRALMQVNAHRDKWDVCDLENLRPESPFVGADLPVGWAGAPLVQHDTRSSLALPERAEDLGSVIPAGILKNVRYLRRRADRDGLAARVYEATPATFAAMFDTFVRLHRSRWASRGQAGVLTDDVVVLHRDAARALLPQGLVRLYTLHLGGHPAAAFYGFAAKGRTAYYLGGFDPLYERYSPGTMLIAHAVERAVMVDHDHTFDFLRGSEAYKRAWGATEQPVYRLSLQAG